MNADDILTQPRVSGRPQLVALGKHSQPSRISVRPRLRYRRCLDHSGRLFRNPEFTVDSLVPNTVPYTFTNTVDLMHQVEVARIYAGFHYHHSVVEGSVLGIKVGHQLLQQYFRRLK